ELFRQIAQAELISEHHLGKTIVKEAEQRGLNISGEVPKGEVIKGNGIRAMVENRELEIGNRKLMAHTGLDVIEEIEEYAVEREKRRICGQTREKREHRNICERGWKSEHDYFDC